MIPKLVFNDAFSFGGDRPLASLADDFQAFRKSAARLGSSPVVEQWGKVAPIPGYALVHLLALGDFEKVSSNQNGDAFESWHVKEAHPTFVSHGALYKDHRSRGPKFGRVVKSAHNDEMGRTELLVAHEIDKCAEWLGKIERNEPAAYSMGYSCDHDVCSICHHKAAHRSQYCEHVKRGAREPHGMNRILPDGRKCFVFNRKGHFNDISMVPVGADPTAFSLRKVAGLGEDEPLSGADLAELYLQKDAAADAGPDVRKTALARKLSAIEKQVAAAGIHSYQGRERRAEPLRGSLKAACDDLRARPFAEICAGLAKVGALLPAADFFALVMGEAYAAHQPVFEKAARAAHGLFGRLEGDPERLARVCAIAAYDAAPSPGVNFKVASLGEYGRRFGLDANRVPAEAQAYVARADRRVLTKEACAPVVDARTETLLDQYAAYKLAACLDLGLADNAEALFAALLVS